MRSGIVIDLTSADRERLERISKDRNTPQKHVWRTEIVLLSAIGLVRGRGANESLGLMDRQRDIHR